MNFVAILFLAILLTSESTNAIGDETRAIAFKAALGVATGVLLSANIALPFVACVFHDVNTMTVSLYGDIVLLHRMNEMNTYHTTLW